MQVFLAILVAVIWIIIKAAGQRRAQQAKQEAEARAAHAQPAHPAPVAVRPVMQPSVAPPPQPVYRAPVPMGDTSVSMEGGNRKGEIASSLTELAHTQRHTLVPSHEAGHAHQESSMEGFEPDCPPVAVRNTTVGIQKAQPTVPGMPAFSWRPEAVLNGMIYAEILSKPKALRG